MRDLTLYSLANIFKSLQFSILKLAVDVVLLIMEMIGTCLRSAVVHLSKCRSCLRYPSYTATTEVQAYRFTKRLDCLLGKLWLWFNPVQALQPSFWCCLLE